MSLICQHGAVLQAWACLALVSVSINTYAHLTQSALSLHSACLNYFSLPFVVIKMVGSCPKGSLSFIVFYLYSAVQYTINLYSAEAQTISSVLLLQG